STNVLDPRFLQQLSAGLFVSAWRRAGAGHAALGCRSPPGRLFAIVGLGRVALLASGATGPLTTTGLLVDGRPGAGFGFILGYALGLVAVLYMFGLALLLVGVLVFAATGHVLAPKRNLLDCRRIP